MQRSFTYQLGHCGVLLLLWMFPLPVLAQQTLFNIPAGEVMPHKGIGFENQSVIFSGYDLETRSSVVYGLGDGYDIGINMLNLKPNLPQQAEYLLKVGDPPRSSWAPAFQVTGQRVYVISKHLRTMLGTKIGYTSALHGSKAGLSHFTYKIAIYQFSAKGKVIAGTYLTDQITAGRGSWLGVLLGVRFSLSDRVQALGDFVSGIHSASGSVLGLYWQASPWVRIKTGVLIPNPGSKSPVGFVLGVNLVSSHQ